MENSREQELMHALVKRAWKDVDFKLKLMSDPVAAIEEVYGSPLNLPSGKNIVVQDQTDTSNIYITIPAEPDLDDMELNEVQLEIVAGGGVLSDPVIIDGAAILKQFI